MGICRWRGSYIGRPDCRRFVLGVLAGNPLSWQAKLGIVDIFFLFFYRQRQQNTPTTHPPKPIMTRQQQATRKEPAHCKNTRNTKLYSKRISQPHPQPPRTEQKKEPPPTRKGTRRNPHNQQTSEQTPKTEVEPPNRNPPASKEKAHPGTGNQDAEPPLQDFERYDSLDIPFFFSFFFFLL